MTQILLKDGTALIHDSNEAVKAVKTDILLEGNKISKIGKDITAPQAQIIDCNDKIISPGFIDTHHHGKCTLVPDEMQANDVSVWHTQLKGRHADQSLLEYMASGNFVSKIFTPEDVFFGQLGGCLEMIDCGTTTVADYAHVNISAEHSKCHLDSRLYLHLHIVQITMQYQPQSHLAYAPVMASLQIRG